MTTPNEELIARLRAGAFPTGMGHWVDLHCEAADALEARQAEIGHVMQGWRCECSTDDACRFARERDTLRAQLAELTATEPVGAIYTIAGVQHCTITKTLEDTDLFTRAMPQDATELVDALEKLARLGNGDQYGHSDGNMIARMALSKYKGAK